MDRSRVGAKSKRKGKKGELEAVHFLGEHGIFARRGVQYAGAEGAPDVIGPEGVHIEVKRYSKMTRGLLDAALDQSERDARTKEVPIVMWREDRGRWQVTLTVRAFARVVHMPIAQTTPITIDAGDFWELWKEVK